MPDFDDSFSAVPFLAVKISRLGKSIAERFAVRYYEEAAPMLCIFAENLIKRLREAGLPWTAATAFDRSCILGSFVSADVVRERPEVKISVLPSGEEFALALPSEEAIASAISRASAYNTLKMGDLILVPMQPTTHLKLEIDSRIEVFFGSELLTDLPVR